MLIAANAALHKLQLLPAAQRDLIFFAPYLAFPGALVLAEEDPAIRLWLSRTINRAVKRADERALFGLAPLPGEPATPQKSDAVRPGGDRERAEH